MLTRDQIKANIDSLQSQGASREDIQGWLDSLKNRAENTHIGSQPGYSSDKPRSTLSFLPGALKDASVEMAKDLISPLTRAAGTISTIPSSLMGKPLPEDNNVKFPVPILPPVYWPSMRKGGLAEPYGTKKEAVGGALGLGALLAPETEELKGLLTSANEFMKGKMFFTSAADIAKQQAAKAAEVAAQTATKEASTAAKTSAQAEATAGKITRPTVKQVETGMDTKAAQGLKYLDPVTGKDILGRPKTSFSEVVANHDAQIKKLQTAVDTRLAADPTPRLPSGLPPQDADFIKSALSDMEEVYSRTKSPSDLSRVRSLSSKFDTSGLTPKEINDLAREYGTTFKNKAFKADGSPSTSWMGEGFENTRSGVKDAARNLMPDDITKQADEATSKLYASRDLVKASADTIKANANKVIPVNAVRRIFQILGTTVGKAANYTGVGSLLKEIMPQMIKVDEKVSAEESQKVLGKMLTDFRKLSGLDGKSLTDELVRMAEEAASRDRISASQRLALPPGTPTPAAGTSSNPIIGSMPGLTPEARNGQLVMPASPPRGSSPSDYGLPTERQTIPTRPYIPREPDPNFRYPGARSSKTSRPMYPGSGKLN